MTQESVKFEGQPAQKKKMNGCLMATIIFVIVSILTVGGCFLLGGAALVGSANKRAEEESEKLKSLLNASPSVLQPTGELADLFNPGSDHTNIQRENKEKEIKGQVVDWTLSVYEVRKSGEKYRIQTKSSISGYGNEVAAFVELTARSQEESAFIEGLKTDDRFRFKGYIDGITLTRDLEIKPAILINPNLPSTSKVEAKIPENKAFHAPVSLQSLPDAEPSQLEPTGELADIFNLGSDHTDIQRKNKEKEIKGQVVDWTLTVYEVSKSGEKYRIQTKSSVGGYGNEVGAFVELTARSQEEVASIEGLKTNDRFRFKGYISGIGMMRTLEIKPAILLNAAAVSSSIGMTSPERKIAQSMEQAERQLDQEAEQALAIGNAIRAAKESTSDKPLLDKALPPNNFNVISSEALKTTTPSDLSPHDTKSAQAWKADAGKIVEWTLSVNDVRRSSDSANIYILETGHGWEISCKVELVANDDRLNKVMENISAKTSISIRGQLAGIEDSSLIIRPAILLPAGIGDSTVKKIESLSKVSQDTLELSSLETDMKPNSNRTTLQQESIRNRFKTLKGSIVQGTFTNYRAEPTSSGCVLVQYDGQAFKRRDNAVCIQIFMPFKDKEVRDRIVSMITSENPLPVPFRGYLTEIDEGIIRINPAILISLSDAPDTPRKFNASNSGQKTDEPKIAAEPIPATAASSATVPAMPGERYPETRLQLLGPADLMDMNLNDLRYAINEMYARRGVVFKNVEIAKTFANKEWFKPRPGVSFEEIEKEFSAIEADNLKLLGKERERKAASADLYELIDSESNLREGPGTNYPIVRKSRKGEVGEALSNKNGWMKLQFSDGLMAWAHEQNLKAAK